MVFSEFSVIRAQQQVSIQEFAYAQRVEDAVESIAYSIFEEAESEMSSSRHGSINRSAIRAIKPGSEKAMLDLPNVLGMRTKKRSRGEMHELMEQDLHIYVKWQERKKLENEICRWLLTIDIDERNRIYYEIQQFLQNESVKELNLSNCKIKTFPSWLTRDVFAARLKGLDISHNELVVLPNDICRLQALEDLDINYNNLEKLPDGICRLINLKYLNLECNRLNELPEAIGLLQNLEILNVGGKGSAEGLRRSDLNLEENEEDHDNKLKKLPNSIFQLRKLIELDVSYNQLEEISNELIQLISLESLGIDGNIFKIFPNVVCCLYQLISLDVSHNDIKRLPDEIERLTQLRFLKATHNPFDDEDWIPAGIGQLYALETLDLEGDKGCRSGIRLPDEIGNLNALKYLNVSDNGLVELPASIGNLRSLETLTISCNEITELPDEIGNLQKLKELHAPYNQISELPESITQLPDLAKLFVVFNQLSRLPDDIAQLRHLTHLDVSGNPTLHGLPEGITDLPSHCTIDLGEEAGAEDSSCSLSLAVLSRLEETIQQPGYAGPRFTYSRADRPFNQPLKPLATLLQELEERGDQAGIAAYLNAFFAQESAENQRSLGMWLSRLDAMQDYKSAQKWLVNNVLKYLHLAANDPKFRETFYATIKGAETTCGDRMALSIIHLGIAYKLEQPMEIRELAEFLKRGVWAMSLLEQCARDRIPSLRFFDEIEVYLGLPIKLKNALRLPIDVNDMLYFQSSALTKEHLRAAYASVSRTIKEKKALYAFLITQDKWKEVLVKQVPKRYRAILENHNKALNKEDVDYEKVHAVLEQKLMALTCEVLAA